MHQFFLSHSVYFDYFMLLQAMRSGGYYDQLYSPKVDIITK